MDWGGGSTATKKKWCKNKKTERKELEVGHCVSGLRKKRKPRTARRGGEKGKTESRRGRRPARSSPDSKLRRDGEGALRLGRAANDASVAACFVLCHTEGPRAGACTAQRPAARFSINLGPFIAATSQRCHRFPTTLPPQNALNPNKLRGREHAADVRCCAFFLLSFLC